MRRTPFFPAFTELPPVLPLFPLAGAVVLPGVQLPLNIFEPRYLRMVADALAADHLIGMIQPTSETALDEVPEIHRTGCAGRITSYSETPDGRIILVLTGVCRFRVIEEIEGLNGYRRARVDWSPFAVDYQTDPQPLPDRAGLLRSLKGYCRQHGIEVPWEDVERLDDQDLVNLLCAHLPLSPEDKQALIEALGTTERAQLMRGLLEMAAASTVRATEQRH